MGSEQKRLTEEQKRRRARLARKKRRQRQIRIRIGLIAVSLLILLWLVLTNRNKKEDVAVINTETDMASEQTEDTQITEIESEEEIVANPTGWKIIVDAGHGGKDQGCAYDEVLEKDINLELALMLEHKLKKSGVEVIMTREDDSFIYLNRRVEAAENVEADAYISIHVDSYPSDASINGITVHYQKGASGGKELANMIRDQLKNDSVSNVRNVMESNLYVLRNTSMAATLIEVGFLTNETDRSNLQSEAFLDNLADSMRDGILTFLEENTTKE